MYRVIFMPKAASQYADIIERFSPYKKKLQTFEKEIEYAIRRLESMPSSYSLKGNMLAARLQKSGFYMFFKINEEAKHVTVVLIISQKQSEESWPIS